MQNSSEQFETNPKEVFIRHLRTRFYRGLDYITLFLYVVVVSVAALAANSLIVFAIEQTVAPTLAKDPIVSKAFDWFRTGSAFLVIITAAIHAVFSALSQLRLEIETTKEPIVGAEPNA